jgi:hypothetical protein
MRRQGAATVRLSPWAYIFRLDTPRPGRRSAPILGGLNEADRVGSLVPPGSKDGFFDAIYVFQNERLFDSLTQPSMRSRHKTLTRTSAGYKLYWEKYGAPGMSVLPSTLIHAPWVTRRLFQPTDRSR